MLKIILSLGLLFSFLVAEMPSDKKIVKKMMIVKADSDNDESIDINVNASVNDDMLTLSITKNGENHQFEIPLGNMDAMHVLKEELDELDIDIDIHQLMGGKMGHGKGNMDKAHKMMKMSHHGKGGFLGVGIDALEGQMAHYFGAKNGGVLITDVMDKSPANKAGMKAGDVVIKVDNINIKTPKDLKKTISSFEPGTKVKLSILRKNRSRKITVKLGESKDSNFNVEMDHNMDYDFDGDEHGMMMFKMQEGNHPPFDAPKKIMPGMMRHKKEMEKLFEDVKKLQEDVELLKKKL